MLQFLALIGTAVGLILAQSPIYRRFDALVRTKLYGTSSPEYYDSDNEAKVERFGSWYTLAVIIIIAVTCYFGPWQYSFPSVFDDDYVASYENGKVIEHPRGAWSYLTQGEIFRAYTKADPYLLYVGRTLYSRKPRVVLEGLTVQLEVTDLDLFYSSRDTRMHGFSAYQKWMDKLVAEKQKELFTKMVQTESVVTPKKNCASSDYFEEILRAFNAASKRRGFHALRIYDSVSDAMCNKPIDEFK